jgi:hypothetical protein
MSKLVEEGKKRESSAAMSSEQVLEAIEQNKPFKGYIATGILKDGIYTIYSRKRLIYRLNTLTGAYSFVTEGHPRNDYNIIKLIRKAKGIHATPIEKAIIQDTKQA